ncbi:hypothetical protein OE88DRAFT_1659946 [Heliocybe sulcata]|uniref:Uncharacterized protein n=1 Tax=Heliocybe sulcata TaxID=5364 RepID=A0A5C3N102_9AGAM|nr:hypothetical protein OE88DRAFT_1659946 [Heliocybe sulcata]
MSNTLPETFQSIIYLPGSEERSFEELRIMDYLFAYSTTSAPPVPCPEGQALRGTESERATYGLSPSTFQPTAITPRMEAELFLFEFSSPHQVVLIADSVNNFITVL